MAILGHWLLYPLFMAARRVSAQSLSAKRSFMEEQPNIISHKIYKNKYLFFVFINFTVIALILIASGLIRINYFLVSFAALLIVCAQYPLLYKYKKKSIRFLIFYLAFVVFCFCINIILAIKMGNQITSFDSLVGLLLRGVFFALAGHIYGLIYFPIILGVNWIIRKKVF